MCEYWCLEKRYDTRGDEDKRNRTKEGLTSHAETSQSILEGLLEAEELEDGKVDGGVKTKTTLVGSESRVILHTKYERASSYDSTRKTDLNTEAAVDLSLTAVVFPNDTELDNTLRDLNDLEGLCVLRVLREERLQAFGKLVKCLWKALVSTK